jgi:3-oxoacyl-[acyl-carrier protein] reductase
MDVKEQVVLVTGGARGIGKAIAENFAKKGAQLVIADISLSSAEETAKELSATGVRTLALRLDVSKSAEVTAAFEKIIKEFGRIDVVINNAGITKDGLILRMKEEDWDAVININLKGVFLCSKEAVKFMVKQRYGRIINIASVVALTKTIAKEYASRGVTANAVAPGFIATAMTDALPDNIKQEMLKSIPVGTFGSVEDVANAVVFLASPDNGYITGQVIHVNGGMYM